MQHLEKKIDFVSKDEKMEFTAAKFLIDQSNNRMMRRYTILHFWYSKIVDYMIKNIVPLKNNCY